MEDMPPSAWQQAAKIYCDLYNQRFTVKDSDILIAAFAMANGYTLVTNNTSDFENMTGLLLVDWMKL
jgi:predicted nucleic acid-binding protein